MNTIKLLPIKSILILASAILLFAAVAAFSGGTTFASVADDLRDGVGATGEAPSGVSVDSIIATVINIFSFVVGVIAVIMIIVGGLKYITSTGDSSKIESAKNTILYAVIGLAIVAVAQVIVIFVIDTIEEGPSNDDSSLVEPAIITLS